MNREEDFHKEREEDAQEYNQISNMWGEDTADIPDWVKDAIIYQIYPDSFASSHQAIRKEGLSLEYEGKTIKSKNGGTIQGITDNLDYLLKLGINCIFINSIFVGEDYHNNAVPDYFHVDPCLGTEDDFKFMVDMCHNCNIRVVIEGVFDHCGENFFAFQEVVDKGEESSHKDWFYRQDSKVNKPENDDGIPSYECYDEGHKMPKLNTSNPEVIEYFCKVCRYWITEYHVDGWFLSNAGDLNDEFVREFRRTSKKESLESLISGALWESTRHWLNRYEYDLVMNYEFRKSCKEFFVLECMDAFEFDTKLTSMRMSDRKNMLYGQLNLLDSLDVTRFYSLCGENQASYKLTILFQMAFWGSPLMLYGDEQQLAGECEEDSRCPMCWEDCESGMFAFYKAAIYLRRKIKAFRRGEYRTISAAKNSKLYVFERILCENDSLKYDKSHLQVKNSNEEEQTHNKEYKQSEEQSFNKDTIRSEERFLIALNAGSNPVKLEIDMGNGLVIWQTGFSNTTLDGYGFVIMKK